ncbi:MAG: hypothetical protein AB7V13_04045 [Pseudorhodoplanes sp.]|uniref:hypothetical protein n=1 Tax=Pseudorhodoplanes sp. TaxID=1934341 RepID=UPI003D119E8E
MDSNLTVKPRENIARTVAGRSNIVRTELSPSQSVNAAQQASVAHYEPTETATREPVIDPRCQAVLDREREERDRRRSRKDEALLRQRAYGRNPEPQEAPQDDAQHADFQV